MDERRICACQGLANAASLGRCPALWFVCKHERVNVPSQP
jgi:hypothetical protein